MIKRTLTYKNYDDKEVTKDLYFNLSKAELIEWDLREQHVDIQGQTATGGLKARLESVLQSGKGSAIIDMLQEVLKRSYGVRTEAGGFRKNEQVWEEFKESGAYDAIFMDFLQDPESLSRFVNAVIPAELLRAVEQEQSNAPRRQPQDHLAKQAPQPRYEVVESPLMSRPPHEPPYDVDLGATDYRRQ